jgi:hypothetical protein
MLHGEIASPEKCIDDSPDIADFPNYNCYFRFFEFFSSDEVRPFTAKTLAFQGGPCVANLIIQISSQ